MTPAQFSYPLIALGELTLLLQARSSTGPVATALRVWLAGQLLCFAVLEPAFLFHLPIYAAVYSAASVASFLLDLIVLSTVLRQQLPAREGLRALAISALVAITLGLTLFGIAREATGVSWLVTEQLLQYLRTAALIVIAVRGRRSPEAWPSQIAWAWLALAGYAFLDAVMIRIQIAIAHTGGPLDVLGASAALFEVFAFRQSLKAVARSESSQLVAVLAKA